MSDLEQALGLFREQLGDFDNIKLLLGGREGMTTEDVGAEILRIALKLKSGEISASGCIDETDLKATTVDLS